MIRALLSPFTWRMAWRDSRLARGRLALYVMAMTCGVAALVALGSFRSNLERAIAAQGKEMLGADYRVRSRQDFDAATEATLARFLDAPASTARSARQISFTSMAAFPRTGATRLIQVRAQAGDYPFYGRLHTEPPGAAAALRTAGSALVDAGLLGATGAAVGDRIRVGRSEYEIRGAVTRIPGEASLNALFGPRVYIPLADLDADLLARGSRIDRTVYVAFPDAAADSAADAPLGAQAFERELRALARDRAELRLDTVESTEERFEDALDDLYAFLSLVGFIALVLGGLGVGNAVAVYVRQKIPSVATLRCLGATARCAFAIHLIQAAAMGVIGAAAGALLGVLVQELLPAVLADALPMTVETRVDLPAVATGLTVGVLVAMLFALLPLLPLRRVPPLLALRPPDEADRPPRDAARVVVALLLAALVIGFARLETRSWHDALAYSLGLGGALLALWLTARLVIALTRHLTPDCLPYVWRQGLANLHRPGNQTVLLLVTVGLGACLILTLRQTRSLLMQQLAFASSGAQPNIVLFDIQSDQIDAVAATVRELGAPVIETVPIVSMRITSITSGADNRGESSRRGSASRREYRSTYRAAARDYEMVVAGRFEGRITDPSAPVPISMEQRQAERLGVALGDGITWDVQGVPVESVVTSLRKVDWRQFRANFFAVFPTGVLEDAPKFHVLTTRGATPQDIGRIQSTLVARFPNVSVIDVTLVEAVAAELFARVSFAIEFMASFSIITGLFVLIGAVLTTRFQRIAESALLRTLGASRRQVQRMAAVEYLALGAFATLTGALLAIGATWAIARFRLRIAFSIDGGALLATLAIVIALTTLVGYLSGRNLHRRPPLEVLRAED